MADKLDRARPPLEFLPPDYTPLVRKAAKLALPAVLRLQTPVARIDIQHIDRLVDLYQRFQAGKVRFLLAFRHPSPSDPLCLSHLIWYALPRAARKSGISLKPPTHFHSIYDRGIPLWAGAGVGWLFSKLGGTPIYRGKADLVGLKSARHLFANGPFPMAAAPEGHTNGHNEVVSPLEPGISQLAFWCAEDLQQAGRAEEVLVVPLGIRYDYLAPPWHEIEALLGRMEAESGLPIPASIIAPGTTDLNDSQRQTLYERLYQLGGHLLIQMERFYQRFYNKSFAEGAGEQIPASNDALRDRMQALLDVALQVSEEYFNVPAKGNFIDRCRRLEQAGWERIFREELRDPDRQSALERGLADRVAEEAELRMWHMRVVESFVAMSGRYVREKPTAERFADTVLLVQRTLERIEGRGRYASVSLGRQRAELSVGEPISVSDRLDDYRASRRGARQAVADLTKDLQQELAAMAAGNPAHTAD